MAEGFLADFVNVRSTHKMVHSRPSMTVANFKAMAEQARFAWQFLWSQLDEARAIAVAYGRDVTVYDRARLEAGDVETNGASVEIGDGPDEYQKWHRYQTWRVVWFQANARPAYVAIRALRKAMPEVVVPKPHEPENFSDEPTRRPSRVVGYVWWALIIAAVAGSMYLFHAASGPTG